MSLADLLNKKIKVFVYCTGAGSGFIDMLWKIPGCSSFFVGAGFPYANSTTSKIIGYTPEKFVSQETSIELAAAAYMEAYQAKESDTENVIGIGLTASVASTKAHRGDHRIIVSIIGNKGCHTYSTIIDKGEGKDQREVDGVIANLILSECLLIESGIKSLTNCLFSFKEKYFDNNELAIKTIMSHPVFDVSGIRFKNANNQSFIFYPGTFNPFHDGHKEFTNAVKSQVSRRSSCNIDIMYCTCINPKHKPPLLLYNILQLILQMRNKDFMLTQDDALYIEKAKKNPSSCFMIGADALLAILDLKWSSNLEETLDEFVKYDTTFYVKGRLVKDKFISLEDIRMQYPILTEKKYAYLFNHIDGRKDLSSTELRNKK